MNATQRDALKTWAESVRDCASFTLAVSGRTIERASTVDELLSAIERAVSLSASVRTYQVLATDAAGGELARTDVKLDPKSRELATSAERELAAREASATAAVIASTDHRVVQATIKTLGEQTSESHSALLGMVAAFGKAGGELMNANAQAVKAIDERASRAEARLSKIEADNDALRAENRELLGLLKEALDTAEKHKRDAQDFMVIVRGAFGPKVDELVRGWTAAREHAQAGETKDGVQ
jgi:hypothetical protein